MYKITSQKNSRRFLIILLSHYLRNYKFNNIILISREISCCFSSKLISQSANLHFLSDEKKPQYQKYIQCDIITTSLLEEWDHQATWLTRPAVFSNTNTSLLALWKKVSKKSLKKFILQLQVLSPIAEGFNNASFVLSLVTRKPFKKLLEYFY